MINEIKQALEDYKEIGLYIGDLSSKRKIEEWLRYLIGEVERKDKELKELQESYQVTNADYKALTDIMDRARKLAYLSGGE